MATDRPDAPDDDELRALARALPGHLDLFPDDRPPEQVGRYRIEGELGRGAMGVVYAGLDPKLERPVAIKLLRSAQGAAAAAWPASGARRRRWPACPTPGS